MKLNDTTALMTAAILAALAICVLACGCGGDNLPAERVPPGSYVRREAASCTAVDLRADGTLLVVRDYYDPPSEATAEAAYESTAETFTTTDAAGDTTSAPWSWDGATLALGSQEYVVAAAQPACPPPVTTPAIVGAWAVREDVVTFAPGGELDITLPGQTPGVQPLPSITGHWFTISSQLVVTLPGWTTPGTSAWSVSADGQELTLDNIFRGTWSRVSQ